eukprot:g3040.t1
MKSKVERRQIRGMGRFERKAKEESELEPKERKERKADSKERKAKPEAKAKTENMADMAVTRGLTERRAKGKESCQATRAKAGRSQEIHLPEPVDLVVHEILGEIASREGVVTSLLDAERFVSPAAKLQCWSARCSVIVKRGSTQCALFHYGQILLVGRNRFYISPLLQGSQMSVAGGVDSSLYPVAVLIDELRHDELQLRVNAVKQLGTIATALGPERTREELLPFLQEIMDDDDDVLVAMAEQLGRGIDLVGGVAYCHALLGPLEELCNVEEITVREKALEAIRSIANHMSPEQAIHLTFSCYAAGLSGLQKRFVPMGGGIKPEQLQWLREELEDAAASDVVCFAQVLLHLCGLIGRLATHDWFTSRISVCSLFTAALPKVGEAKKQELLKKYCTPGSQAKATSTIPPICKALIVEHTERIKLQAELTEAVAARTKAESSEAEAEADLAEAEALLGRLREALASQEAALEQLAAEKMAAEKALRDIRRLDSIAVPTKAPKVSESPKASPEKKAEKIPIPIELEVSGTLAAVEQKPGAKNHQTAHSLAKRLTFFVMQSFQEPPRRSTLGAPRKGWADKDWNWGSPFGTAHDEAMALRERLDTRETHGEQRETWLKRLESGQVDVEEMKLALGLRIQHAARQGLDGDGAGWALMQDMAACKYEGSDGQKLLKEERACGHVA